MKESAIKKNSILRNNEYYGMQQIFDKLYADAKDGRNFNDIMKYISMKENILLAYRTIKNNKGSQTSGVDGKTIDYYKKMDEEKFVSMIQNDLKNYHPKKVRRVEISKPGGGIRPLGIPCIEDRIVQQCIKQVMEPICEAKFHKHSYGFRPNRSTSHAIARSMTLIQKVNLHYVVDIDITGFFDNVNHSKLYKQMWSMGFKDKNLLCVIKKIVSSEIDRVGIPTKGTPQGGILSPLLSNIVLNELDWWVSSQWETFKTKRTYCKASSSGRANSNRERAMKTTNLKQMYIVRYADDFKIFCNDYKTAQKAYIAVTNWLKERLGLEISPKKSKITNLRKGYSEFLGFKLKAIRKSNKYVVKSHVSDKSKKEIEKKLKNQIKLIKEKTNANEVNKLNAMILGMQNYYKIATHVCGDFYQINFLVRRTLYNRLKKNGRYGPPVGNAINRLYADCKSRFFTICDVSIFPLHYVKTEPPMNFNNKVCNYTSEGRKFTHTNLGSSTIYKVRYLLYETNNRDNTELRDNKISLMCGQQGKCFVTKETLEIGNMECHHKIPRYMDGDDSYSNLVWLKTDVHKLIHAVNELVVNQYLDKLNLDNMGLKRVNSLRALVGNTKL